MDRGKAKMTEDDIAAELRAQRLHSRAAVGEGLHLQPSFERGLPTSNDRSEHVAQQFLDDRYITLTENAWRVFSDSRTYPLPPNSMLQGMEPLSTSAPRTMEDIRSDLFVGLRDVASQNVSPWDVPASVSSPTKAKFQASFNMPASSVSQQMGQLGASPQPPPIDGDQTIDVTTCNVQASSNMPASYVSQQLGQLSQTPQPPPIDGDQSWDFYITPSMIKPVPSWPFGAMGRPCFCEGSWHFIVADDGREAYLDERSFLRIMSRGGFKYERRGRMQIPGKHR